MWICKSPKKGSLVSDETVQGMVSSPAADQGADKQSAMTPHGIMLRSDERGICLLTITVNPHFSYFAQSQIFRTRALILQIGVWPHHGVMGTVDKDGGAGYVTALW